MKERNGFKYLSEEEEKKKDKKTPPKKNPTKDEINEDLFKILTPRM